MTRHGNGSIERGPNSMTHAGRKKQAAHARCLLLVTMQLLRL